VVKVIRAASPAGRPRRLLMVAYFFPPQPKSGAHRLGHIADHLVEFGWEVTVITPAQYPTNAKRLDRGDDSAARQLGNFAQATRLARSWIKRVPALKRAALACLSLLQLPHTLRNFPDSTTWWIQPAVRQIEALLRQRPYDAILTTHSPCSGHLIGATIARRHGIPWLADYQDLWTGNGSSLKSPVRRSIELRIERAALRGATAVSCCKESFVERLVSVIAQPRRARTITVIPFAVDSGIWEDIPDTPPDEFRVTFVGNMYAQHITPDLLLRALAGLQREGSAAGLAVRFHYYGINGAVVREAAAVCGSRNVTDHGLVPRRAALQAERSSALLVSIVNPDSKAPNIRQWFPSKLFEYAGSKRRILAIAPAGSIIQRFIEESGLGYFATDEASCAAALRSAYAEFLAGTASVVARPTWQFCTPRDVAERFAAVLNSIVPSPGPQTPQSSSARAQVRAN